MHGRTFKFSLEGIGRKISMREQLAIIELFKPCGYREEDVKLDQPEDVYRVIEGPDNTAYFGLLLAGCRTDMNKKGTKWETFYTRYSLK